MNRDDTERAAESDRQDPDDDAALLALLKDWLPDQRWFAGTAATRDAIDLLDRRQVSDDGHEPGVELVLVAADTPAGRAVYQVLLGWRADPPADLGRAVLGRVGERICFDALHDRDVTAMLLAALAGGGSLGAVRAATAPGAEIDPTAPGRLLDAEQSNTSIVYGDSVILKMFRRLDPGTNPDVELHRALQRVGCRHIAEPVGEFVASVSGVPTTLGLATRFIAGSADGWSMATASVRDLMAEGDLHAHEVGGDFAPEAFRLGAAVAQVHGDLATACGTETMAAAEVGALVQELAAGAERLAEQVPSLDEHMTAIRSAFDRAARGATADPVPIQRIHGDLHLGQALRTVAGWVLIDFEGEPSRPIAQRRSRHSPLQDVAGMLRSFDYAAHQKLGAGAVSDAQRAYRAAEWRHRNRAAFCTGYASVSGADPRAGGPLLQAFELAKAVYEVGYEHGHRPAWESVPLAAVAELSKAD